MDAVNRDTHKKISTKLDYDTSSVPEYKSFMQKYNFQKLSNIPYL